VHYPVTLSYALAVDTHLSSRLLDVNGQSLGTVELLIPAGARQTFIDLPAPLPSTSAPMAAQWILAFSNADNALFVSNGVTALTQQVPLSVEGSTAAGQIGGSALPESVVLSAGNDFYQGLGGDDELTGGAGIDTALYSGPRNDYQLQRLSPQGDWQVGPVATAGTAAKSDGTDTLKQFERLRFTDMQIALDLDANAGVAAKILGAVFGKSAVANKAYVGIALDLLDQGMSYDALASFALGVAKATTNDQIVTCLWGNVVGSAPYATDKAPFVAWLEAGLSAGALAHLAADLPANQSNINLVGLVQTGLAYTPVGAAP
jgi:hypothetical protein